MKLSDEEKDEDEYQPVIGKDEDDEEGEKEEKENLMRQSQSQRRSRKVIVLRGPGLTCMFYLVSG